MVSSSNGQLQYTISNMQHAPIYAIACLKAALHSQRIEYACTVFASAILHMNLLPHRRYAYLFQLYTVVLGVYVSLYIQIPAESPDFQLLRFLLGTYQHLYGQSSLICFSKSS